MNGRECAKCISGTLSFFYPHSPIFCFPFFPLFFVFPKTSHFFPKTRVFSFGFGKVIAHPHIPSYFCIVEKTTTLPGNVQGRVFFEFSLHYLLIGSYAENASRLIRGITSVKPRRASVESFILRRCPLSVKSAESVGGCSSLLCEPQKIKFQK